MAIRYKEPTEILSQRVETLNTQRTEKLNRVKLVEKEKDELEGPKNEAMAYIKLENEHAQLKFNLQQVRKSHIFASVLKIHIYFFFCFIALPSPSVKSYCRQRKKERKSERRNG